MDNLNLHIKTNGIEFISCYQGLFREHKTFRSLLTEKDMWGILAEEVILDKTEDKFKTFGLSTVLEEVELELFENKSGAEHIKLYRFKGYTIDKNNTTEYDNPIINSTDFVGKINNKHTINWELKDSEDAKSNLITDRTGDYLTKHLGEPVVLLTGVLDIENASKVKYYSCKHEDNGTYLYIKVTDLIILLLEGALTLVNNNKINPLDYRFEKYTEEISYADLIYKYILEGDIEIYNLIKYELSKNIKEKFENVHIYDDVSDIDLLLTDRLIDIDIKPIDFHKVKEYEHVEELLMLTLLIKKERGY